MCESDLKITYKMWDSVRLYDPALMAEPKPLLTEFGWAFIIDLSCNISDPVIETNFSSFSFLFSSFQFSYCSFVELPLQPYLPVWSMSI